MVLYTYRYLFRSDDMEEGKIGVKVVTDTLDAIASFEEKIASDDHIISCLKEYVSECNLEFLGITTSVKEENKKEGKENVT